MKITLLLGSGVNPPYEAGLLSGLIQRVDEIDIIGGEIEDSLIPKGRNVRRVISNDYGHPTASVKSKYLKLLTFYLKLVKYAFKTNSALFHIQWFNKLVIFDRIFLTSLFKFLGKTLVFTAHNIDAEARDGQSSFINRCSLRFFYHLMDHIIVHTDKMKSELLEGFGVHGKKVSVIRHGVLHIMPQFALTRNEARKQLNIEGTERVILFFGNIAPYKGLEYLLLAIPILKERLNDFKVVVAGAVKKQYTDYWLLMKKIIEDHNLDQYLIVTSEFIPDNDVELYFKSADALVLPYKNIFQTGVLFLSYGFGLPVIAADVGSLQEDVIEGKTGFMCQPEDPVDLACKIVMFFDSELFKKAEENRKLIMDYADEKYSWNKIGERTYALYRKLIQT